MDIVTMWRSFYLLTLIRNEEGLRKCLDPNSTYLLCVNSNLRTVPGNLFTDVEILDLQNNFITNIRRESFKNYTKLKHINLQSNWIYDIEEGSFINLTKLRHLYLSHNRLQKFDQRLPEIHYLKIEYNPLEYVNISDSVVYSISMSARKVKNINDLQLPRSLIKLEFTERYTKYEISFNEIAPFCNLQKANLILYTYNPCQTEALKTWFPEFEIKVYFSEWFLEDTNCTEEQIKELNEAQSLRDECRKSSNASGIALNDESSIYDISNIYRINHILCFGRNTIAVDCINLKLSAVPGNLTKKVEILDLRRNSIHIIWRESFRNYSNLKYINLRLNRITEIEEDSFRNLTKLRYLYLSKNQLIEFDQRLPEIHFLDLYDNPLEHVNISDSIVYSIDMEYTKVSNFNDLQLPSSLIELKMTGTINTILIEDIAPLCNLKYFVFSGKLSYSCDYQTVKTWIPLGNAFPFQSLITGTTLCTEEDAKLLAKAQKLRTKCLESSKASGSHLNNNDSIQKSIALILATIVMLLTYL